MHSFVSIIIWIYYGVCFLVYFFIVTLLFFLTFPFDPYRQIPNRLLRGLGAMMLKFNPGWKIEILGVDRFREGHPTIFVANHQSFLDMPLSYLLPWGMKWVAKRSLFRIPVLGWLIYMTGHLGIDRSSRRSVKKLDKLVEPIEEGIPAMMFPEGTRSRDGELTHFKNGAFMLARRYNFLVQPLVLDGGHRALPSGEWRFSLKQKLTASVLEPIDPADFESMEELKQHTREQIEQELKRLRGRNNRE